MNIFLKATALAALVALGSAASAQATPAAPGADLPELLALARAANPDYTSARFEAQAAAERIEPAGALADPRLRVEWFDITRGDTQFPTVLPANTGRTVYTFLQPLPWWGKRELKRAIATQDAQAADSRAQATWVALAARVKVTHAQRYYLDRDQKLTQELLDLTDRLSRVAQVRYAGGLAPQQDSIRAQLEQTKLQTELVALQSQARQADAQLNALLARPAQAALATPAALPALPALARLDADVLLERLRTNNPQLFTAEARIKAAELKRDLTLKDRYPDFSVGLRPIQVQNRVNEWGLVLELNIPLQQDTRRAQEREAQALLEAAQTRRTALADKMTADLLSNLAAIDAARHTEQLASTNQMPQAEATFQSALAGYENGKLDFATLLEAQRQVRAARRGQLKAQLDAQMRLAEIENLIGETL